MMSHPGAPPGGRVLKQETEGKGQSEMLHDQGLGPVRGRHLQTPVDTSDPSFPPSPRWQDLGEEETVPTKRFGVRDSRKTFPGGIRPQLQV